MKDNIFIVFCTIGDYNQANYLSKILIQKKLAACCTAINGATSIYEWKGTIEESKETLLIIKTTQRKYQQLEKEIKMVHNYSVPEIIAIKVETGSQAYIDWILSSTESVGK